MITSVSSSTTRSGQAELAGLPNALPFAFPSFRPHEAVAPSVIWWCHGFRVPKLSDLFFQILINSSKAQREDNEFVGSTNFWFRNLSTISRFVNKMETDATRSTAPIPSACCWRWRCSFSCRSSSCSSCCFCGLGKCGRQVFHNCFSTKTMT